MNISNKQIRKAYSYAESVATSKEILDMLFKRDDYKKIKSYEDACAVLKECPIVNDLKEPKHIIALMKLETISRALWGK